MAVAQRLYEGIDIGNGQEGLITYMRTDSTRLSNVYMAAAHDLDSETVRQGIFRLVSGKERCECPGCP